jgi:hypothetical protein
MSIEGVSTADGVGDALLDIAGLGSACELFVGRCLIARRRRVLLTLGHEGLERGAGELLFGRLYFSGWGGRGWYLRARGGGREQEEGCRCKIFHCRPLGWRDVINAGR